MMLALLIALVTSDQNLAALVGAVLSGAAAAAIIQAIAQRRKVGADATAVVTAAARELVDPLRKELAQERADNAEDVKRAKENAHYLRMEAEAATKEARLLRDALHEARLEADAMRTEREIFIRRIRALELQLLEAREAERRPLD